MKHPLTLSHTLPQQARVVSLVGLQEIALDSTIAEAC